MSPDAFDLIHADVWNPFATFSHDRYTYFLTIMDDCTRYIWIYMLKQKFDVLIMIPQFFKLIFTQYDKNIKMFRSDNAPQHFFDESFKIGKKKSFISFHMCLGLSKILW